MVSFAVADLGTKALDERGLTDTMNGATGFAANALNIAKNFINVALEENAIPALQQDISEMTPNEAIDLVIDKIPAFAGVGAVMQQSGNEELAEALQNVMVQDDTFIPGTMKYMSGENGASSLEAIEKAIANPEVAANLTMALNEVAAQDSVTFEQLDNLLVAIEAKDVEAINVAYKALGFTEEEANAATQNLQNFAMQDFLQNFLENPMESIGQLGNMLVDMGWPPGIVDTITGFLPQIAEFIGNVPEFAGNLFEGSGYQQVWQDHIQPAVADVRADGHFIRADAAAANNDTVVPDGP